MRLDREPALVCPDSEERYLYVLLKSSGLPRARHTARCGFASADLYGFRVVSNMSSLTPRRRRECTNRLSPFHLRVSSHEQSNRCLHSHKRNRGKDESCNNMRHGVGSMRHWVWSGEMNTRENKRWTISHQIKTKSRYTLPHRLAFPRRTPTLQVLYSWRPTSALHKKRITRYI